MSDSYSSNSTDLCPLCSQPLGSASIFQKHMNEHHKEAKMLPFNCDECQHGFFTLSGLRYHQETHGGQKFTCFVCNAKLKHKTIMRRHMEGTHMLKECRYCESYFQQGQEFNQHIVSCSTNKKNNA